MGCDFRVASETRGEVDHYPFSQLSHFLMDILSKIVKNSVEIWALYKPKERRNIGIYVVGIVLYRFGLEVFNGSIITLAIDRFSPEHTFETLGALTGLNQAMQFFGAVLIVQSLLYSLTMFLGTSGEVWFYSNYFGNSSLNLRCNDQHTFNCRSPYWRQHQKLW